MDINRLFQLSFAELYRFRMFFECFSNDGETKGDPRRETNSILYSSGIRIIRFKCQAKEGYCPAVSTTVSKRYFQ